MAAWEIAVMMMMMMTMKRNNINDVMTDDVWNSNDDVMCGNDDINGIK